MRLIRSRRDAECHQQNAPDQDHRGEEAGHSQLDRQFPQTTFLPADILVPAGQMLYSLSRGAETGPHKAELLDSLDHPPFQSFKDFLASTESTLRICAGLLVAGEFVDDPRDCHEN